MKPFKKNQVGWDDGMRFKVIDYKKWGNTYIYKVRFTYGKTHWIEYQEHNKIQKRGCFRYNYDGSLKGDYFSSERK